MLSKDDRKFWGPNTLVMEWLKKEFSGGKVLDVGPGHHPLTWATKAVDFAATINNAACPVDVCDFATNALPYSDKEFDFVYCRHVLEDMWNPFGICKEMSRVGRAGYIEMPSPICEIGRGVDGGSPPYRGYHHHRFLGWTVQNNKTNKPALMVASKYPFIEYLNFDEGRVDELLRKGDGRYWNTYYLWDGEIDILHTQSPLNFDIPTQYVKILDAAMAASMAATDKFFADMEG